MAYKIYPELTGNIKIRCSWGIDPSYGYDVDIETLFGMLASAGIHDCVLRYYFYGYAIHNNFGEPTGTLYIADSDYFGTNKSISFSFPNTPGNFPTNYYIVDYNGQPTIRPETGYSTQYSLIGDKDGVTYYSVSPSAPLGDYQCYYITDYEGEIVYNGQAPITYNWSSVPAISGKNGILLPMSTLNDINNGNEVTTSDTSKFNLNDSSNIKNLVDAVVNDF